MKLLKLILPLALLFTCSFCSSEPDPVANPEPPTSTQYFPPLTGTTWQTKSIDSLGWNANALPDLLAYLQLKNSKSFMILVDGKIVVEEYFNNHSATTNWYWASAGKTLTSTVTGIAVQEGFVDLNKKVSDYIGTGWTSMPLTKESLITNMHLLTMTSGIDDLANGDCLTPECLTYKADAGTRWAYHSVYVKLQDVVTAAVNQNFEDYFSAKLKNKIGMNGSWINLNSSRVYTSTTRSMARFGLLILNNGKWENEQIINSDFVQKATHTSQEINKSYGYLWWINGESSYRLPQVQIQFPGSIITAGADDMFMALGKNDQKIYVIPSKKIVVVRMGEAADESNAALSDFDEVLWQKMNLFIN